MDVVEHINMTTLVVGGAGYIGSHMVKMMCEEGHDVVVFDNLSGGYRDAIVGGLFEYGDLADIHDLKRVFKKYNFDAVMHFASYIQVGASINNPSLYYQNNLINTLNLLNVMVLFGVKRFVFSSTAAIFGEPKYLPINEEHPLFPVNPYGRTKLMVEHILDDYDTAYGLKSVCLRYFNASGGDPDGLIGEQHNPETHLIPLLMQVASKRKDNIIIYGNDYDTIDGTCVRDYIHIIDICQAHLLSLELLKSEGKSTKYNLGNSKGYSVNEVVEVAKQITGREISTLLGPRREGDPACLVADSSKAKEVLGWCPEYSDLNIIVKHSWNWEIEMNIKEH